MKAVEVRAGMANGDDQRSEESPTPSTRLAVSISPTTKAAIDRLVEREGITQTEAVRRLIGYGDMVYRLTQIDGEELLVRHGDSFDRIVVI